MSIDEKRNGVDLDAVKEWLSRYSETFKSACFMEDRATLLRERAGSPSSPNLDGMPHEKGSVSDKVGNLVGMAVDMEAEASRAFKEARTIYREIDRTIKQIHGSGYPDKRYVLQMKYLDGMNWSEINDALWISKEDFLDKEDSYARRTFKIHRAALVSIAEYIPKEAEQIPVPDNQVQEINTKRKDRKS